MLKHVKTNTAQQPPRLITRNQLADRWQVSPMSLKRYELRGIIRPLKLAPRVVRYSLESIEAYERESTLDRQEVTA